MKAYEVVDFCKSIESDSTHEISWQRDIVLKTGQVVKKRCTGKLALGSDYSVVCKAGGFDTEVKRPTLWLLDKYVKVTNNNKMVLVCYTVKDQKTKVEYYLGGCHVSLDHILNDMYAKDKPKTIKDETVMFNINVNDILSLV